MGPLGATCPRVVIVPNVTGSARSFPRARASLSEAAEGDVSKLLEVCDLETKFYTVDGVVNALNGISYSVDRGECLAIVGESGSGKTVGVLSILRLIEFPPGRIVGGSIHFKGTDLLQLDAQALRKIRGAEIAIVFQDPMTSLNPSCGSGRRSSRT